MRDLLLRALLITPALALIASAQGAVSPALGACQAPGPACGDGIGVPCSCGDTVVTYTRLSGSDPVLQTPCPFDGLFVVGHDRIDAGARVGAKHPPLGSPVVAHEVRGDPVQPRTERARRVEAVPLCECCSEGLRCEIVGRGRSDSTTQIAVKRSELCLERFLK